MPHKLIAELAALRAELAHCLIYAEERVPGVRAEVERVRQAVAGRAEQLEAQASDLVEQHQDMAAAQATIDARSARAALDADAEHDTAPAPAEEPPAAPDTGKKAAVKTGFSAPADGGQPAADGGADGGTAA
jgi:hypothetical protein